MLRRPRDPLYPSLAIIFLLSPVAIYLTIDGKPWWSIVFVLGLGVGALLALSIR